jgi:hypothetical protein
MTRRSDAGDVLQWRLTPPQIERNDGLVPFLIDWGSTPHPTSRHLPRTRLTSWTANHPPLASFRGLSQRSDANSTSRRVTVRN